MLSASMIRRASPSRTRSALASSSIFTSARSISHLRTNNTSTVALGKRPALTLSSPLLSTVYPRGSIVAASTSVAYPHLRRNLSWTPWKSTTSPLPTLDSSSPAPSPPQITEEVAPSSSVSPSLPEINNQVTPVDPSLSSLPSDPSLLPQPPADGVTPTLAELINNSGLPLQDVLNSPEAIHAAMTVSDLQLLGLQHWWISLAPWIEKALVAMHTSTGLPWWASIAAVTVGIRLCLFPLIVRNMSHNVRLQAVSPQMQALMKALGEAKKNNDLTAIQINSLHLQKLLKEHNVSPFRPLLMPMIQLPFFLGMFYALKALADAPLPQLKEGGLGWVTDLTAADPWFILPITSIALQLAVFRVGVDGTSASSNRTMGHVRNAILLTSPLSIWLLSSFPSAVLFYWTFTNAWTVFQAFILRSEAARAILRIPKAIAPPPPPPGTPVVNTNPSVKDSINALREHFSNTMEQARQKQAEQLEARARYQAAQGRRPSAVNVMTERVNEPAAASSSSTEVSSSTATGEGAAAPGTPTSSFLETSAAAAESATGLPSREEVKRRRVEAARAKRARR